MIRFIAPEVESRASRIASIILAAPVTPCSLSIAHDSILISSLLAGIETKRNSSSIAAPLVLPLGERLKSEKRTKAVAE